MRLLLLDLKYDVRTSEFIHVYSNLRNSGRLESFIMNFLRGVLEKQRDYTPYEERNIYTIRLGLNLEDDLYWCDHNCGSESLRDGILIQFIMKDIHKHDVTNDLLEVDNKAGRIFITDEEITI